MRTQQQRDAAILGRPSAWSQRLSRAETAVLFVGILTLAGLALSTLVPAGRRGLGLGSRASVTLVAAAAVYAVGHLLRGLRLAVLLNDPVVGVRRIFAAHILTSGLSLLLPFRLGDLVRMRVTGALVGSTARGVVAIVLERCLDVGVILGISVVAASAGGSSRLFTPLLVVSGVFVVATVAAVTVVPKYLDAISLYLVRRPAAPGGARLVAGMERVMRILDEAPRLIRRRTPTLVALTAMVWLAELVALRLAVPVLADSLVRLTGALASFLSSLSSGSVALLPDALTEALSRAPQLGSVQAADLRAYRLVLVVPLLWASVAAGGAIRSALVGAGRPARRKLPW